MGCTLTQLEALQTGDLEAGIVIDSLYRENLYKLAIDITSNKTVAEDIVNIVFLKAVHLCKNFRQPIDLETFLLNTVKQHAYNYLKFPVSAEQE
jgi:DNA-directed RNA polymerase specialized sigma24 family protein